MIKNDNDKMINHIDHWGIHVQSAAKCPVNGCQANSEPLSFI